MNRRPTRLALGVALAGAAVAAAAADSPSCKALDLGFNTGPGWAHRPLSKLKRDTVYSLQSEETRNELQAVADGSASLFLTKVDMLPTTQNTLLSWRWKTDALIPGADNRDRKREDAPLRVIVAFDGDRSKLPDADRASLDRAKRLSGTAPPYATLMYIWSEQVPLEQLIPSAHSSRLKMIVVTSGTSGLGQWQTLQRRLADDFRRSFGEAPGPVIGVAVMTDADNTKGKASGRYSDIRLACARP